MGSSASIIARSEEHTSELQSREKLVCRLLLEKKKMSAIAAVPAEERCLASVARLRIVGLLPPKGLQRNRSEPTTAANCRAARRKPVTSASSRHIALDIHGLWLSPLGW